MITSNYGLYSETSRMTAGTRTEEEKLKETCQDFEAIFLHKMMQTMRTSSMESELFNKSAGEKMFTDMLDQEYSVIASRSSTGGIGDMMFEQMKKSLNNVESEGANTMHDIQKKLLDMKSGEAAEKGRLAAGAVPVM